jgi:hypothetical protein
MASTCATPIKGTHIRIVALDECGIPVTGAASKVFTTEGFVQVAAEPQYEDGEEFFERTASGAICVNQKDAPVYKRDQLTIDFCQVDAELAAYVLDARVLASPAVTGTAKGFVQGEGQPASRWSLEVWQKVAGSGACDASGAQQFIYNFWPNVGNAQRGGYTIENARATFQVVAETEGAAEEWGNGPGTGTSWLPSGEVIETGDHYGWVITTTALPTAACGSTTLS